MANLTITNINQKSVDRIATALEALKDKQTLDLEKAQKHSRAAQAAARESQYKARAALKTADDLLTAFRAYRAFWEPYLNHSGMAKVAGDFKPVVAVADKAINEAAQKLDNIDPEPL